MMIEVLAAIFMFGFSVWVILYASDAPSQVREALASSRTRRNNRKLGDLDLIDFINILSVLKTEQELDFILYKFGLAKATPAVRELLNHGWPSSNGPLFNRLYDSPTLSPPPPGEWFQPARFAVVSPESRAKTRLLD